MSMHDIRGREAETDYHGATKTGTFGEGGGPGLGGGAAVDT